MKKLILVIIVFLNLSANSNLPLYILPHNCNAGKVMAHSGMRSTMFELVGYNGSQNAKVEYITSTLKRLDVKLNANILTPPKSMSDNYHALVANVTDGNRVYSAIYYIYKHGKPSNTSPTKLTSLSKAKFEIQPDPLPREHDRYTSSKEYIFKVLYDGIPQALHIELVTLNGTKELLKSDKSGILKFTLPNDFKNVKNSRRANKPSYFILNASKDANGIEYYTSFSGEYHVNPNDYWQSSLYGVVVAVVGFILGMLLYKRSKNG